jgi:ubiquinone/menaquinone biosynthesis C-methylase UbiE
MSTPTARFSTRVDNYIRYRPGYPKELFQLLKSECGLTPDSVVADIGSGTGLLTRDFLENGNQVFAVEPNEQMRAAAERLLAEFSGFQSISGTAEATTLSDHSVDLVIAAQAAHWFNPSEARREFIRILKPGGWTVLVWNERRTHSTPFLAAYEHLLLSYATDYEDVRHEKTTSSIDKFFDPTPFRSRTFEMIQKFDYEALRGRLLSSSYTPQESDSRHAPMLQELRRIFDRHQIGGQVTFEYDTRVYYAQLL